MVFLMKYLLMSAGLRRGCQSLLYAHDGKLHHFYGIYILLYDMVDV